MLRRFVTLLAFLTGLAAIGAPVQARASEMPGVGLVASAELRAECTQKQTARAERRLQGAGKAAAKQPCRKLPSIVYFPPVMLKADRARE